MKKFILLITLLITSSFSLEEKLNKDILLEKNSSYTNFENEKYILDLEFIKNNKDCIIRKSKYKEETYKKEINDITLPCKMYLMQIEQSTENEYKVINESIDEINLKNNKKSIENIKFIKDKQICIIEYKQTIKENNNNNFLKEEIIIISNDCNSIVKKIKEN